MTLENYNQPTNIHIIILIMVLIKWLRQVVLESYYQLADSGRCVAESRGGLLHELFHVFGVGIVTIVLTCIIIIISMIKITNTIISTIIHHHKNCSPPSSQSRPTSPLLWPSGHAHPEEGWQRQVCLGIDSPIIEYYQYQHCPYQYHTTVSNWHFNILQYSNVPV